MDDVAAVAAKALELLKRDGWCQRRSKDSAGQRCVGRAWDEATYAVADANQAWRYTVTGANCQPLKEAIMGQYACEGIAGWNDAPERTFDQVVAVLEKLAAG